VRVGKRKRTSERKKKGEGNWDNPSKGKETEGVGGRQRE